MRRGPVFTPRAWRWLMIPLALGILVLAAVRGPAPPERAFYSPWSLISR